MSFATLTEAMNAFDTLIEKMDGDLIKAQEWNDLVYGIIRMGTDLQTLTDKVGAIETYVGYEEAYSGDNLKQRIEALEGYVGQADDAAGAATLSGRVATLEAADNVTQNEFDELESSIEPLLEQYVVRFESDDSDYLLGETATVTATVRTLNGEIPTGRPWIDFIATWGRLKAAPGFDGLEGASHRSISVRTNNQGIARVQVTAEQNKRLSIEEEAEVSQFFMMELVGEPISFKDAIKNAPTTQSEYMELCYGAVTNEYRSARQAIQKLADDYYIDATMGSHWGQIEPQNRWNKYRATVVGFAKNDADPTTPDPARGVSSIQLLFKDWVGPWVDYYEQDDDDEVTLWVDQFHHWAEAGPNQFLDHLEVQMEESIFQLGVVGRQKGLKALARAAEQVDDSVFHDPGEWVKDVVRYAADAQRDTDVLQYAKGTTEASSAGSSTMKAILTQGKQVNVVDERAAQAKDEVLASSEFGNLQEAVSILQNSTTNVGKEIIGALSDIEHKVVNINAFDSEALQTSVNEIKAHIGVARNLVPDI